MGHFGHKDKAPFTDEALPDQTGKVFIVTGPTSGVGELLADILYSKNAKVYLAARSANKAEETKRKLQDKRPESTGELVFLPLDLNDLSSIKASAEEFLSKETKLNVLFNNAGVMNPPEGSQSKQGYELQMGINTLAPFLFTKLLTPILKETVKGEPEGSVRVVWVSSSAPARFAPKGGVEMDNINYEQSRTSWQRYGISKSGNILHAAEHARRHHHDGIISVSLDPGNLKTPLYDNTSKLEMVFINIFLKEPVFGAYTELFAGFSPVVTMKDNGRFIQPFGKIGHTRDDIEVSRRSKEEGGNGNAEAFWEWSEKQVAPYV